MAVDRAMMLTAAFKPSFDWCMAVLPAETALRHSFLRRSGEGRRDPPLTDDTPDGADAHTLGLFKSRSATKY
jgi:hypothetical protein